MFFSDLFVAVFSHFPPHIPHVQTPSKESFWIPIPTSAASTLHTPAPSLPTHQSFFLSTSSSKVTCPYSPSFWDVHGLSEGCRGFSSSRVTPGTGTERILSSLLLSCVLSIPGKAAATRRKSCKEPHREQMKTTAPPGPDSSNNDSTHPPALFALLSPKILTPNITFIPRKGQSTAPVSGDQMAASSKPPAHSLQIGWVGSSTSPHTCHGMSMDPNDLPMPGGN